MRITADNVRVQPISARFELVTNQGASDAGSRCVMPFTLAGTPAQSGSSCAALLLSGPLPKPRLGPTVTLPLASSSVCIRRRPPFQAARYQGASWRTPPVIENQKIGAAESGQEAGVGAIPLGYLQVRQGAYPDFVDTRELGM